jgi:SAM-dependent methyltransferase
MAAKVGKSLVMSAIYTYKSDRYSSHNQILEMIAPGASVLDVGCGRGVLSGHLARMGCAVVGVDREEGDASFTQYMNSYIRRDLETPAFFLSEQLFDYVVAADILEHLRNRQQLLKNIAKALEPQGFLIVSTGNIALFVYRLLLLLGRFDYREKGILDEDHVRLFTLSSFAREIEDAGFLIVERRYTPIPFERVFPDRLARGRCVELLTMLYQTMVRIWPRMFAYQVILKAKLKDSG